MFGLFGRTGGFMRAQYMRTIWRSASTKGTSSENLLRNKAVVESISIKISDSKYPSTKLIQYGSLVNIYIIGTSHKSQLSNESVTKLIKASRPCSVMTEVSDNALLYMEYISNPEYTNYNVYSHFGLVGLVKKLLLTRMLKKGNYGGKEFHAAFQAATDVRSSIISIEPLIPKHLSFYIMHFLYDFKNLLTGETENANFGDLFLLLKSYLRERHAETPNPDSLIPYWKALPRLHKALVSERDNQMALNIIQQIDVYSNRVASSNYNNELPLNFVVIVGCGHVRGIIESLNSMFCKRRQISSLHVK